MVRSTRSRRATRRAGKRGGGWSQGPALSQTAYYVPEYKMYSECYPMDRPGMIQSNPNPALAQTAMAGGGCGCGKLFGGQNGGSTTFVGSPWSATNWPSANNANH